MRIKIEITDPLTDEQVEQIKRVLAELGMSDITVSRQPAEKCPKCGAEMCEADYGEGWHAECSARCDESELCQWNVGDLIMARLDGKRDPFEAVINAVDIPTRRLRVISESSGIQHWVYMEWCYKP